MSFYTLVIPHLPDPYFLDTATRNKIEEKINSGNIDEDEKDIYKEMLYMRAKPDLSEKRKGNYYKLLCV